ncbi:MAG: hypothetical protein DRN99_09675 [Thermoproteota archaeon]|nr:MAG: hypothetical protein DRN99_09675 [Candidatus Korarchaeota archaeon]
MFIIVMGFRSHPPYRVWSSEIFPTSMRATATSLTFSVARGLPIGGLTSFNTRPSQSNASSHTRIPTNVHNPASTTRNKGESAKAS